jgi:hypothetical protein
MKIINALTMSYMTENEMKKNHPVFIIYKNKDINILSFDKIELIKKVDYKVLTDKGWKTPSANMEFPIETDICEDIDVISNKYVWGKRKLNASAMLAAGNETHACIGKDVLNASLSCKKYFIDKFEYYKQPNKEYFTQIIASVKYIKKCIENDNTIIDVK